MDKGGIGRRIGPGERLCHYYGSDEIAIGSLRLTIFLSADPSPEGSTQGIPASIEAEADAIVQSYEEHGWEE